MIAAWTMSQHSTISSDITDVAPTCQYRNDNAVNWEIFGVWKHWCINCSCKQIFKGAPQNILTQKFSVVEITMHVLLIKWLLTTCSSLFHYRNS